MIDTLLHQRLVFRKPSILDEHNLLDQNYFVIAIHRPANVDEDTKLGALLETIVEHSRNLPFIFPVHLRTRKILEKVAVNAPNVFITEPLGYLEFNYLVKHAKAVITDLGGFTEETTVMRVPCIIFRSSTERLETVTHGTNELLGTNPKALKPALDRLFAGEWKKGSIPEKWDGMAAVRIVDILATLTL